MTEENKTMETEKKETKREELIRTIKFVLFSISAGVIEIGVFTLLYELLHCDCVVLKARSPSCGPDAVYDGSFSGTLVPGSGVTAKALAGRQIPVLSEESDWGSLLD